MSAANLGFVVGGTSAVLTGTAFSYIHPLVGLGVGLAVASLPLWSSRTVLALNALEFPRGERLSAAHRTIVFPRQLGFFAGLKEPGTGKPPRFIAQEPHPLGWKVRLKTALPTSYFEKRASHIAAALHIVRVIVSADKPGTVDLIGVTKFPLDSERPARVWAKVRPAIDGLGIPIVVGRIELGTDLVLDLAEQAHIAVQGITRSGKSMLATQLIACALNSPSVRVTGVDPSGILLDGIEGAVNGTSNLQDAAKLLESLVTEMDARISRLAQSDDDVLWDFNKEQPLVLVVLEELPGLISAADAQDKFLAARIRRATSRLVQEGLKVGLRLLVLAQRFDASLLGGSIRANFAVRISLRADSAEAVKMLHPLADEDTIAWLLHAHPGNGLIDKPGEASRRFRADFLPFKSFREVVKSFEKSDLS